MEGYPKEPLPQSKISAFSKLEVQTVCGLPILPIRETIKKATTPEFDIIDEALFHIRTNIFMRDFPAKSGADRLIIYLTFYGMKCLKAISKTPKDKKKCQLELDGWNLKPFPIPGDGGFVIDSYVSNPETEAEKTILKDYFKKLRTEMGNRLMERVFGKGNEADKWWICFGNRKFLEKEMTN